MTERGEISRELVRRAAIGFPFGAALVYLVFLLGGLFGFPAPEGTAFCQPGDSGSSGRPTPFRMARTSCRQPTYRTAHISR